MNLEGSVKLRVTESPSGMAKSSEVLGGNAVFSKAARRMRFYEEMGARPAGNPGCREPQFPSATVHS